jgi:hypothetical protein
VFRRASSPMIRECLTALGAPRGVCPARYREPDTGVVRDEQVRRQRLRNPPRDLTIHECTRSAHTTRFAPRKRPVGLSQPDPFHTSTAPEGPLWNGPSQTREHATPAGNAHTCNGPGGTSSRSHGTRRHVASPVSAPCVGCAGAPQPGTRRSSTPDRATFDRTVYRTGTGPES